MNVATKCPSCGAVGKIYGMPYGLQIGTSKEGEAPDMDEVVLIKCEECGAVLGGYGKKVK
jgi:uncharacterized Zn finger protein